MSRLEQRFADLAAASRKALIPYIMTGDPDPGVTVPLMHAMVEAGADVIELGAPFSDPMADGPVIQQAAERALANGIESTIIPCTNNATELVIRRFDPHYQNFCGFDSLASARRIVHPSAFLCYNPSMSVNISDHRQRRVFPELTWLAARKRR